MITLRKPSPRGQRRGSILVFTVFLLSAAALAVYVVVNLSTTNMHQVRKSEARLQAQYAAEAGIQQTVDWFNRGYYAWYVESRAAEVANAEAPLGYETSSRSAPDAMKKPTPEPTAPPPDPTASPTPEPTSDPPGGDDDVAYHTWGDKRFPDTDFQNYFKPDPTTGKFIDALKKSTITTELNLMSDKDKAYRAYLPSLLDQDGNEKARIVGLRILPPQSGDPEGTVAQVICETVTVAALGPHKKTLEDGTVVGDEKTAVCQVHVWLQDNRVSDVKIPAAIMSKAGVATNGQFNVHWGEVWSEGDIDFPNSSHLGPTQSEDEWYVARATDHIRIGGDYADGRDKQGTSSTAIPSTAGNYYVPYLQDAEFQANSGKFGNRENMLQHVGKLPWPDYDYKTMKALALERGFLIFRPAGNGLLALNTPSGTVEKSFEDWFDHKIVTLSGADVELESISPEDIDPDDFPPLYFIDTTDGKPPMDDGSNMMDVQLAGGSSFFHGLFFCALDFSFKGSGNPPSIPNAERPDLATESISKCFWQGLLYTYGTYSDSGSGRLYGAIFAENGYGAGGCPEVYYDWRLSDIMRNRLGSAVKPRLWQTRFIQIEDTTVAELMEN